jgi:hypothetical protein
MISLDFIISKISESEICFCFQDGRIDYGEFVAMMKKGDDDQVGRSRTKKGNINFNIADAFGVKEESS